MRKVSACSYSRLPLSLRIYNTSKTDNSIQEIKIASLRLSDDRHARNDTFFQSQNLQLEGF
jgi:hypothetical protein